MKMGMVFLLFFVAIFAAPSSGQSDAGTYNRIGTIRGHVEINNTELRWVPSPGQYLVFQRVGCKKCLVGINADSKGDYKVSLGLGKYKLIVYQPTPPLEDMLAPSQARYVEVCSAIEEIVFDIALVPGP